MRKTRSDAKLLNLPEEQQAQLAEWLLDGMPYHIAKIKAQADFGVSVGLAAFSGFYQEVCVPQLLVRRTRARETADQIGEDLASRPGNFDAATVDAIKQKAFELAISPQSNPKDVKALFVLLQKQRQQELDLQDAETARAFKDRELSAREDALALEREKFEFDAAKKVLEALPQVKQIAADPKLSDRDRITEIRRALWGSLPEDKTASAILPPT